MKFNIIECPHCKGDVQIFDNELNCKIFRHGIYIRTGMQINPHLCKKDCDDLVENNLIYGCGKPFIVKFNDDNQLVADICDYI